MAARPSGAVLLAVLRGRSSEGLNFSHDHARAVVMVRIIRDNARIEDVGTSQSCMVSQVRILWTQVSIAFPPIHDLKVASKRSRPRGAEWYTGQAFKVRQRGVRGVWI